MDDIEIDGRVRRRREALARLDPALAAGLGFDDGVWGLALSGGGIRSATFCFGLLRAFAASRLLLRFDVLSTVSGGGYIGATFGRMVHNIRNGDDLRAVIAALAGSRSSWMVAWLRANGRYLAPAGVADRLYAAAVYARNLVAVHVELGVIGLLLGAALSAFDVGAWSLLDKLVLAHPALEEMQLWREWINWIPSVWVLLAIAVALMAVLGLAYQAVPMVGRFGSSVAVGAVAAAVLAWILFDASKLEAPVDNVGWDARRLLVGFGVALAVGWLVAVPVAWGVYIAGCVGDAWRAASRPWRLARLREAIRRRQESSSRNPPSQPPSEALDALRSRLTRGLAWLFQASIAIVLLGLVDRAAWWLSYEHASWQNAGIALALAASLARTLVPLLATAAPGGGIDRYALPAANVVGQLLTLALCTWWVAVVHRTVLSQIFTPVGPQPAAPLLLLAKLAVASGLYLAATGWNVQFLNLFSLHSFYRGRLIRSYLGAANADRFPSGPKGRSPVGAAALAAQSLDDIAGASPIRDVDPADDLSIHSYKPHEQGGPVHLINVCVNETGSRRTAIFNRDRRGRQMTVVAGGLARLGQRPWSTMARGPAALTLGSWVAISGAAVGSALGSRTRAGISALAMFAGARLGYWWDSEVLGGTPRPNVAQRVRRGLLAKSRRLLDEVRGHFKIVDGKSWYLTDGGHFENTGAYALLAQRCRFIVLADCGADPKYAFDDLENLVRKARIDLQCDVRFQRPKGQAPTAHPDPALAADFGSLNDLASNASSSCLALARIDYLGESPSQGYLVLVKPNLCRGLPVDLFNFKQEQPDFPQQSTAEQFFGEAQWESYSQLGCVLGAKLTRARVDMFLRSAEDWFEDDDGISPEVRPASADESTASVSRLPTRLVTATAVTASIGIGAFVTAGIGAWQAVEGWRGGLAQSARNDDAAIKELAGLWARLPAPSRSSAHVADAGSAPTAAAAPAGALAAALARVSSRLCKPGERPSWFERSPLAVDILAAGWVACAELPPDAAPPACRWLEAATAPVALAGTTAGQEHTACLRDELARIEEARGEPDCYAYWAYDYRRQAVRPCSPPGFKAPWEAAEISSGRGTAYTVGGSGAVPPKAAGACSRYTIRPAIVSWSQGGRAAALAQRWAALGATVDPTENLIAKATTESRPPPLVARVDTIRQPSEAASACVAAMRCPSGGPECADPAGRFVVEAAVPEGSPRRWTIDVLVTSPNLSEAVEAHRRALAEATGPSLPSETHRWVLP